MAGLLVLVRKMWGRISPGYIRRSMSDYQKQSLLRMAFLTRELNTLIPLCQKPAKNDSNTLSLAPIKLTRILFKFNYQLIKHKIKRKNEL